MLDYHHSPLPDSDAQPVAGGGASGNFYGKEYGLINKGLSQKYTQYIHTVIPAKAGIQFLRSEWIPGQAGMTVNCMFISGANPDMI